VRRHRLDPWHWLRTPAAREPAALFCDFDGTLVPFVYRPDGVVVPHGVISLLSSLEHTLDHAIAIVSGRPLAQLDKWLYPFAGAVAGLHGAEIRTSSEAIVRRVPVAGVPDDLRQRVQSAMRQLAPAGRPFIEDKGLALALHYSSPISSDEVTAALLACLIGHVDWQLGQGRRVVEIRHRFANKGQAVATLLQSPAFAARRAICLGDDVTDLDMFDAVRGSGGISIAVGSRLRHRGDLSLTAPSEVRMWLQHFVRAQRRH
jgi:trehalose 6-phosphate phosphatase